MRHYWAPTCALLLLATAAEISASQSQPNLASLCFRTSECGVPSNTLSEVSVCSLGSMLPSGFKPPGRLFSYRFSDHAAA